MRVISGKYRGMTLAEFAGDDIRPTADRVKESLFNIIFSRVQSAEVLDLFCGSGSLGIECISRGAAFVHFNDVSPQSVAVLGKNLAKIKESCYRVTTSDYSACLGGIKGKFDIIFLDPPYRLEVGRSALSLISKYSLLKDGGIAVLERDVPFVGDADGLEMYDQRRYGRTYLNFFRVKL